MTLIRFILVLGAAIGLLCQSAFCQQPDTRRGAVPVIPNRGSEAFRGLLRYFKVEPVRPEQLKPEDYPNLIVIVLGRPEIQSDVTPYTQQTLRAGGAVLIAVEHPIQLSNFFPEPPGLVVSGAFVVDKPKEAYAELVECPYVVPHEPVGFDKALAFLNPLDSEWSLFTGIDELATNMPGTILVSQESKYVRSQLAGYSPSARLTFRGRLTAQSVSRDQLFAVGGSGGKKDPFKSLVLADPSVFSNQMMIPPMGRPSNDNFLFAVRLLQWLRGPGGRTKCLFIENGIPIDNFDVVRYDALQGMPPLPVPSPLDLLKPEFQQKLTDAFNRKIADIQDNDSINRKLAGTDRRYRESLWFLASVAATVLLLLLLRRGWRARHDPDVPPIPSDTGHVVGAAQPGSLARRREEILQSGDYTEVVREYLQELFASNGLNDPGSKPSSQLPTVRITGRGNTTLREYLHILWGVAYGSSTAQVTYSRWKELEPMIEFVRRAAEDGRWRFADTGESA